MQSINLLHYCTIALSLVTSAGVFVHDTKLDQATTTALARPSEAQEGSKGPVKLANMPHTHSERGSLYQAVKDVKNGNPRLNPRENERRINMTKKVSKGVHVFDGYYVPLGEL